MASNASNCKSKVKDDNYGLQIIVTTLHIIEFIPYKKQGLPLSFQLGPACLDTYIGIYAIKGLLKR